MTKNALYLLCFLPLISGCTKVADCTEGNGIVTSVVHPAGNFEEVLVEGNMEVYLQRGTDQAIRIEADSNLHKLITATVDGGELKLGTTACISNSAPVRVYLTAPLFTRLELEGSGSISSTELISSENDLELTVNGSGNISMEVHAKKLESAVDGSGSITLKGTADGQVVEVDGSGKYRAFDLKVNETVISLAGSGDVEVTANGALTVDHKGSGNVRYRGTPSKINSDVSGSGKLEQVQ